MRRLRGGSTPTIDATLGEEPSAEPRNGGFERRGKARRSDKSAGEARVAIVRANPSTQLTLCYALLGRASSFYCALTIGGTLAHFHPTADGAALRHTHIDLRPWPTVRRMNGGGVYLNVGSAVVLPEVFLKCVTLVRNLGNELSDITTANFDFIQSYRPTTNVVRRPTADGAGHGYSITGHHELTIPLLAAELICGTQK